MVKDTLIDEGLQVADDLLDRATGIDTGYFEQVDVLLVTKCSVTFAQAVRKSFEPVCASESNEFW